MLGHIWRHPCWQPLEYTIATITLREWENALHQRASYTFSAVKIESVSGLKFVSEYNNLISSLLERKIENAIL